MSFNDVAIVYVKRNAYRIQVLYMSKDDAISIINNSNLIDKEGVLWFFLLRIKNKWENLLVKIQQRCDPKYDTDKED